ncbi:glycosyltransferase [Psychroflexus sp. CAK57W]|uniref:glycosyltransferase n=1 Tax=Psychroflexus curvus TaxID=2873595 RepID=UPI001CCBC553|nr:glycosyltransferase [Psychroflexus curvus]MBZ9627674.1 glycosyltransferase [Psychroflexus curvus]MBZ9786161.1 glycosyltransferase [Psychroflexus curvus]
MKFILLLFLISTLYILIQQFKTAYLFSEHKAYSSDSKKTQPPVSVVICARNEARNLSEHLEFILNQNYPQFEVIVVDDCSTDSTSEVVKQLQEKYAYLKLIQLQTKVSDSKRNALKTGIHASLHELILLTDADCRPISKDWISTMSSRLSTSKSCVLGYSPYIAYSSFLNFIIQFETLQTASLYISKAIENKAYMSVGRNVMYTKQLFFDNENFDNEKHLISGDDDMLIQNIEDSSKITVSLNADSFVLSQPKTNWKTWCKQKLRHYSTAYHYKSSSQLFLGLYHFFHALFWVSFLILVFGQFSDIAFGVYVLTILIRSILIRIYAKILKVSKPVLFIWPILEACLLLLQLGLGLISRLKKQQTWQ